MKKRTLFIWFVVIATATYGLYEVKWQVRQLREKNLLAEADIVKEKQALEVLSAEWAYLTRPERLQVLVQKHLPNLVPGNGTQVAELEEFPPKPATVEEEKGGVTYSSYSADQ